MTKLIISDPTQRKFGILSQSLSVAWQHVQPENVHGYWEVDISELAHAAFQARQLARLLTKLEKEGDGLMLRMVDPPPEARP